MRRPGSRLCKLFPAAHRLLVQAVLLSFFELAGILWSAAIANTIHCTIRRVQQVERRELENAQNRRSGSHPQQSLIDTEYALDICIADLG